MGTFLSPCPNCRSMAPMRVRTVFGAPVLFRNLVIDRLLMDVRPHMKPRRVLLMGRAETADALATLVSFWGHEPCFLADARQGVDAVAQLKPAALVVEVLPGNPEGLKLANQLRRRGQLPDVMVAVA